jgi:hypothetical protein
MVTETRMRQSRLYLPDQHGELLLPPDAVFNPSQVEHNVNLETTGTVQLYSMGTRFEDIFGRVFRYVEFGGTVAQNSMVQAEAPDAEHDNMVIAAAVVAGAITMELDGGAGCCDDIVANEYAGGFLYSEALVSGIVYPIKSHDALDVSDGCVTGTFNLWTPVQTAIAAAASVRLVKSKFKEVIIAPHSTSTGMIIGSCAGSGAVDGRFGWVQTQGPAKVLTNGTVVVGEQVTITTAAADGAVSPAALDTDCENLGIVGTVIVVGPTTEWSLINLFGLE